MAVAFLDCVVWFAKFRLERPEDTDQGAFGVFAS